MISCSVALDGGLPEIVRNYYQGNVTSGEEIDYYTEMKKDRKK